MGQTTVSRKAQDRIGTVAANGEASVVPSHARATSAAPTVPDLVMVGMDSPPRLQIAVLGQCLCDRAICPTARATSRVGSTGYLVVASG